VTKAWTVLVIGSGGREHALGRRLLECDSVQRVVVTPGNGASAVTQTVGGREFSSAAGDVLSLARSLRPDLVVVGPEQPLVEGLVDELNGAGFVAYGPSREAARLEGSKAFMKEFAVRHGIATAQHVTISAASDLDAGLGRFEAPPVVKATGLCAGKGVVVAESFEEARSAANEMLSGAAFGAAGNTVVLEERLYGQEVSVHAVCDGERALILPPIQDHKRIGEGDTGPNTGGMGTYGPAKVVTPELARDIEENTVRPLLLGMARAGTPFRGTLFANMMLSPTRGPLLLEINVRFGDPETQVLMGLIDGDLAALLHSAAQGQLQPEAITVSDRHGLCVVLAAGGYPANPEKGRLIHGIEAAEQVPGVRVYHAGTRREGDQLLTAGGRVLSVTASGASLEEAQQRAYAACARVHFEGMQYRRDIGHLALRPSLSS
jgi:phosphoribosylamine---glycine ligase